MKLNCSIESLYWSCINDQLQKLKQRDLKLQKCLNLHAWTHRDTKYNIPKFSHVMSHPVMSTQSLPLPQYSINIEHTQLPFKTGWFSWPLYRHSSRISKISMISVLYDHVILCLSLVTIYTTKKDPYFTESYHAHISPIPCFLKLFMGILQVRKEFFPSFP